MNVNLCQRIHQLKFSFRNISFSDCFAWQSQNMNYFCFTCIYLTERTLKIMNNFLPFLHVAVIYISKYDERHLQPSSNEFNSSTSSRHKQLQPTTISKQSNNLFKTFSTFRYLSCCRWKCKRIFDSFFMNYDFFIHFYLNFYHRWLFFSLDLSSLCAWLNTCWHSVFLFPLVQFPCIVFFGFQFRECVCMSTVEDFRWRLVFCSNFMEVFLCDGINVLLMRFNR